MTLPLDTQIGQILDELIEANTTSYFIKKYRSKAVSYQKSVEDGSIIHRFVTKKNLWGPVEIITIQEQNSEVLTIGILSKKHNDYSKVADCIYKNNFEEFHRNDTVTYYSLPLSMRYIVGIGQNVQQNGDTFQTIMNKMLFM
jgi:hypothetical protein